MHSIYFSYFIAPAITTPPVSNVIRCCGTIHLVYDIIVQAIIRRLVRNPEVGKQSLLSIFTGNSVTGTSSASMAVTMASPELFADAIECTTVGYTQQFC